MSNNTSSERVLRVVSGVGVMTTGKFTSQLEDLLHHVPRTSTIAFVDYVATVYSPPSTSHLPLTSQSSIL